MNKSLYKARINFKSLSSEIRHIRQELRKTRDVEVQSGMQSHLANRVKPEARLAHLASCFLRGTEYSRVENKTDSPIHPDTLYNKLKRFDQDIGRSQVRDWLIGVTVS